MRVAQDRREPAPPFALSLPLSLPLPPSLPMSLRLSFTFCGPVEERVSERDEESVSAIVRRAKRAGHKVGDRREEGWKECGGDAREEERREGAS